MTSLSLQGQHIELGDTIQEEEERRDISLEVRKLDRSPLFILELRLTKMTMICIRHTYIKLNKELSKKILLCKMVITKAKVTKMLVKIGRIKLTNISDATRKALKETEGHIKERWVTI